MNAFEITNSTNKEIELLFAQKELELISPKFEEVDFFSEDFCSSFTLEEFEAEPTEEQKRINQLNEKIEILQAEIEAERISEIEAKIEENNNIIKELREKIGALKVTKAGRSFVNFYTGKSQFMTFTEINAAKLQNQIVCILNENKELEESK